MTKKRRKEIEEEISDLRREADEAGNNADAYEREERRLNRRADDLQCELDDDDGEEDE